METSLHNPMSQKNISLWFVRFLEEYFQGKRDGAPLGSDLSLVEPHCGTLDRTVLDLSILTCIPRGSHL